MKHVITGGPQWKFNCQGKKANHKKPIRVSVTHDVQCKLNEGTLVEFTDVPKPKPAPPKPKVEPKPEPKVEAKVDKKQKASDK